MAMEDSSNVSKPVLRVAVESACALGENPMWHAEERRLYWCDIVRGQLLRLNPDTGANEIVRGGSMIGGFTVEADGALLLFMGEGRIERWSGGEAEVIAEAHPEMRETRFNDVIADPAGRVFCGTMTAAAEAEKLYRLDTDRSLTEVIANVGCSNGLAFSGDCRTLYHTDSFARTITAFDYDIGQGEICNPRVFAKTMQADGLPDGLTVDAEDHLWSARWDAGVIVRYAPSGEEVQRIEVPVRKSTSIAFGGDRLQTMFITTAGGDRRDIEGTQAGNLFAIEPGVRGKAEFRSRVCTRPRG
jgi:sugar lactone lactonase YvrE